MRVTVMSAQEGALSRLGRFGSRALYLQRFIS